MLNIVIQQGRLVAEPNIYKGASEKGEYIYARFRIAVARDYKDRDGNKKSDFKNCEAVGQTAKFVEEFYHKGDTVIVVGPWYTKEYTKDNEKRSYDYISVSNTYPSNLKGQEKAIIENLADTRKMESGQIKEVDPDYVPYDEADIPPLPEEYQHIFK